MKVVKWLKDHTEEINMILQIKFILITSADDGLINLYNIDQNYTHIGVIRNRENKEIYALAPLPPFSLLSGGTSQHISVWDLVSGRKT
jgi:WD40 repeat protein